MCVVFDGATGCYRDYTYTIYMYVYTSRYNISDQQVKNESLRLSICGGELNNRPT